VGGPRRRVTFLARPLVHGHLVPACLTHGQRLRGRPSTLPTIPLLSQPPTMRTRSGAQLRRDGLDPSASEALHADGAPPAAGASHDDGGDVTFLYSHGPYAGIQVTRRDVRSLNVGQEARDAVVDALARYIWQEELASSDARGCLVFCSIFYKILRERGPAAVLSMTQSINVFDYSTWVFFLCEGNHWFCAVIYDVPRLGRALKLSADERAAPTGRSVATLAFFNSLGGGGASRYSRARTSLFGWVRTVALDFTGAGTGTPPARWVATCLSVVSPSVPQQGATVDCGMYALSFFSSFFKCPVENRRDLLRPGAEGRAAWSSVFVLKTREELLDVCSMLEARFTAAAARQRAPRQLAATRALASGASRAVSLAASAATRPHEDVCTPDTIKNLPSRSTAAPKTEGLAGSAPSGHVAIALRAERPPRPSHSSLCAELPTSTTPAPPRLAPAKREAALALTPSLAQDAEATGTHLPSLARGSPPRTQGPGAATDTVPTKAAPTRPTKASRRPMSMADTAAAAWLAAFAKWGLEYEPEVARDLINIFSACDALLPSFVTHYASGVARWCPPVNQDGLEQWFVDEISTGPGHGRPREERAERSGCISRAMLSRVHGVFCAAYAFHGTPLPGA